MPTSQLIMLGVSLVAAAAVGVALYRKRILHPRAFGATEAKQRDVWGVPAPVWFVCAAMVYLSHHFFTGLAMSLPPAIRGAADSPKGLAVPSLLGYASAAAIAGLLIWLIVPRLSAKSGFRTAWSDLWIGAACLLLAAPFYVLVSTGVQAVQQVVTGVPPPEVAHTTLEIILKQRADPWTWGIVVAAVVFAPIVEELIFRAFLQSCLLSLFGRTWPAIAVTSVLFTLVHVSATPWVALPGLYVLSIALGLAYERTRSLGVPIVMHVCFNALNVVIAVMSARG